MGKEAAKRPKFSYMHCNPLVKPNYRDISIGIYMGSPIGFKININRFKAIYFQQHPLRNLLYLHFIHIYILLPDIHNPHLINVQSIFTPLHQSISASAVNVYNSHVADHNIIL